MEELSQRERVVICLGSNSGDRRRAVAEAIAWLRKELEQFTASDIYETPAYGHVGASYMNAVVAGRLRNFVTPFSMEQRCKQYERDYGRDEEARRLNLVPIDIDIVKAGAEILRPADFSRQFFRIGYAMISGEEE